MTPAILTYKYDYVNHHEIIKELSLIKCKQVDNLTNQQGYPQKATGSLNQRAIPPVPYGVGFRRGLLGQTPPHRLSTVSISIRKSKGGFMGRLLRWLFLLTVILTMRNGDVLTYPGADCLITQFDEADGFEWVWVGRLNEKQNFVGEAAVKVLKLRKAEMVTGDKI
jgi:hypothetical protein